MLDIGQRRPLVSPSSGDGEGLVSETPHPEHQLIATEMPYAGCPVNPRPRDQRTYSAACHAAEGQGVQEFDASEIVTGMHAWCGTRFLPVVEVSHLTIADIVDPITAGETSRSHPFVLLRLADHGGTGWIIGEVNAPVYVLA